MNFNFHLMFSHLSFTLLENYNNFQFKLIFSTGLKNCMERWIEPGRLKGPIKVQNLKVNNLITTVGFSVPLPLEVGNVQSKTNIYIGTINNIDLGKLLDNIVQEQDAISLTNVTFGTNTINL